MSLNLAGETGKSWSLSGRTLVVLIGFGGWLLVSAAIGWGRGGWMDEFLSYQFTDPRISAVELHRSAWSGEPYIPTYYYMLHHWRKMTDPGMDLFAMRSLSLAGSAILAMVSLAAYSRFIERNSAFPILLFSSPALIYFSAEARLYFIVFFSSVLFSIYCLAALDDRQRDRAERSLIVIMGALAALASASHFIALLFTGFCCLGAFVLGLVGRKPFAVGSSLAIGLCVLLPALAYCVVSSGLLTVAKSFWITRHELLEAVLYLPFLVGAPVTCAAAMALRRSGSPSGGELQRASIMLFGVAALFVLLVSALSVLKPMIVLRYLTPVAGFLVPPAAVLLQPALSRLREPMQALVAVAALGLGGVFALIPPYSSGEWRDPGLFLAQTPACRGARIPSAILTEIPADMDPWKIMFQWYGGMDKTFVPATPEAVAVTRGGDCPVRLWAGDLQERYLTPDLRQAMKSICAAEPGVAILRFRRGYLFLAPGADTSRWSGAKLTCADLG